MASTVVHDETGQRVSGRYTLLIAALGIFLAALDQTVIVTAIPSMIDELGITINELDRALWIITGYLLGYTVAMPLVGRIADVFGLRRLFIASMLLFGVASIGCAMADSLEPLVAWRIVQAIGGGAVLPIGMAIAVAQTRGSTATALGLIGAAAEAGGVLGPAYGGIITENFGWRWVFWVNLPLTVIICGALYLSMRENIPARRKVDWVGGALLAGALTALSLALSRAAGGLVAGELEGLGVQDVEWTSPQTMALLAGAIICTALFVWWERRTAEPLIQMSAFRIPAFSAANATNLLVGIALIIAMVDVPLLENSVRGGDALSGGLMLMRLTVMIPIGAVLGGVLMRRVPGRWVAVAGLAIAAAGFWLMSTWGVDIAEPRLTIDLLLTGLGFGLVIAPVSEAATGAVDAERITTAAALVTVMRLVGMTLGLAVLASWSIDQQTLRLSTIDVFNMTQEQILSASNQALLSIYTDSFRAAAVLCVIALLPAMLLPRAVSRQHGPILLG